MVKPRRPRLSRSRGVGKAKGSRRRLTGSNIVTPAYAPGMGPRPAVSSSGGGASSSAGRGIRPMKRRRIGPVMRRLRMGQRVEVGGQMTFRKARFGRGRRVTVKKLQRMTMTTAILRFQGLKRYGVLNPTAINAGPTEAAGAADQQENKVDLSGAGGVPGYYRLRNTNIGELGTNGTVDEMPLHIYDLTVCPNNSGRPVNAWSLGFEQQTNSAKPVFGTLTGQTPNASVDVGFNFEYTTVPVSGDAGTGNITPQCKAKYIKHEWYDIRLLVYGQRQFTTYYDIMVVRFNEDCLVPDFNVTGAESELDVKRTSFWQAMVKNITYNPLIPGHARAFNGMQVLRRYRCVLDSSSQDNADRTPAHKVFKIFMRDGVIRNYDYGSRPHTSITNIDGPQYMQNVRINDLNDRPLPKSRTYLVIRASNTVPEDDTQDMDGQPSYDLVIRKKIRFEPFQ